MLRSLARFALPMLLLGLMISSAFAQGGRGPGGGGPGGFGGGGGGLFLLMDENVRKDLGLVDDQTEKLRAIARKMFEGMGGGGGQDFRRMSEEERTKFREESQARQEKALKEVDEILLPAQRERFKQIQVQSRLRGSTSDGLASKEVADALGITEAQKEELKKVQEDAEKELREKQDALRQEVKDKVLKVLTTEQKAKLEKLMGTKIEFAQFGGRGGPGGQGGPGGGNRGPGGRPAASPASDDN